MTAHDEVERELVLLLGRGRGWSRVIATELHPGLHPTAYAVLSRVHDLTSVRASALCGHFDMDKGAMSRRLAELETTGLLVRTPDPEDGRAQRLALSAVGRQRLMQARDGRRRMVRDQLQQWPDADVDMFAALMHRFNRQLDDNQGGDLLGHSTTDQEIV